MQRTLSLTTRGIDLPDSMRALIEERTRQLERFHPHLVGCSVLVLGPGRHHRTGGPFSVEIDLRTPGADPIVVTRQKGEDLQVGIRESFDAARRRLEDLSREQRGKVKRHRHQPTGRVEKIFAGEGYGFILTDEAPSREIYFHRNSLLGADFDALAAGTRVRFHEEPGLEGPQASSVTVTARQPAATRQRGGRGPGKRAKAPSAKRAMRIRDLMTSAPATCSPQEPLAAALARMWENDCGILPVVDQGRLVGVVTDRDIAMALLFRDARAGEVQVQALTQGSVHSCSPDDDVPTALAIMAEHRVRRLPVTENERLVGIVSINDILLEARATQAAAAGPSHRDVVQALQAIGTHRELPAT
jgi:CBS domain-containing protein/cold shock CspA family protein